MKQVIENLKNGKITVVENPIPKCGPNEILVHNLASLISPGTEKLLIEMGKKSLAGKALARPDLVSLAYQKAKREGFLNVFKEALDRLDQPLPLGYSSSGIVIEKGTNIKNITIGDSVACTGFTFASHAEIISVPQEMCVKLPSVYDSGKTIEYEEAAFVMLGGIALQGFRSAEGTPGENIVIIGLGLLGLLTMQIARSYGCIPIGIDVEPKKIELAKNLGFEYTYTLNNTDIENIILSLTNGYGADKIILAAATKDNSPILLAEKIARKRAKIVLVGVSDVSLTRKAFWDKELTFTVSKASGPTIEYQKGNPFLPIELVRWPEFNNHQEFIRLVSVGLVNVKSLITHRFPIENATKAYDIILNGTEPYIGVIIEYPQNLPTLQKISLRPIKAEIEKSNVVYNRQNIGFIGAGMFTKNFLLPKVIQIKGNNLIGIATKTGTTGTHVGNKFKFNYTTTDYEQILNDKNIGSVVITTRHNLHGKIVAESIQSKKNIFVEKPLCINQEDLDLIINAYKNSEENLVLMVGFNRRYSVLSHKLKQSLQYRKIPLQMIFRINAGYISPDHWTQDHTIGGGRIIGEVCHFIDFFQFITDADPIEVFTHSINSNSGRFLNDDNINLSIKFSDGSLGIISYSALGTKSFSRERFEMFSDNIVAIIEDFRTLEIYSATKRKKMKLSNQDMGYTKELDTFIKIQPSESKYLFRQAVLTTLTTLKAVESLNTGKPMFIPKVEAFG
ncbi:MAG: oxidoreductase [Flavobacterium sp.]|nr:oxidoreductase [Flavobacterium sp.]